MNPSSFHLPMSPEPQPLRERPRTGTWPARVHGVRHRRRGFLHALRQRHDPPRRVFVPRDVWGYSARTQSCPSKHPDGYRETVFRRR